MLANEQQQKDIEWIKDEFGGGSNLGNKSLEYANFLLKQCPPNRTRSKVLKSLRDTVKLAEQSIKEGLPPEKEAKEVKSDGERTDND